MMFCTPPERHGDWHPPLAFSRFFVHIHVFAAVWALWLDWKYTKLGRSSVAGTIDVSSCLFRVANGPMISSNWRAHHV